MRHILIKNEVRHTPQKVLDLAYQFGVHSICLEADWEGACEDCRSLTHLAFDHFYGHARDSTEALMMIINDILEDTESK